MSAFYAEIQDGRQKHWGKKIFGKVAHSLCKYPGDQKFAKIALSRTVSEINGFLCFTQKFKMAAKNDGKTIFGGKSRQMIADSLGVKIWSK